MALGKEKILNNHSIFFSIVIPLYNKENSIVRAVESVLNQENKNFELIIINDGSTDNSANLIVDLISKDNRVQLHSQENSGVSVARNKGVSFANSEYVCFLDADDEWYPYYLNEISLMVQKHPDCAFYCSRFETIEENGDCLLGKEIRVNNCPVLSNFYLSFAQSRALVNSSNVCVSKKHLDLIGGFPSGAKTGEDIYVWLRLGGIGDVCYSNRVSARIHKDAENRTDVRIQPEIPYYIKYFLEDAEPDSNFKYKYEQERFSGIEKFLLKSIVVNSAAAKMQGFNDYDSYIYYAKNLSLTAYLVVSFIKYIPNSVISAAKKIRNILTMQEI